MPIIILTYISGEIPTELANINSLAFIRLYTNQLTGNIPFDFSSMPNLQELNLAQNQLKGIVPDFSVNNASPLKLLQIQENRFTFEDLLLSSNAKTLIAGNSEYEWEKYDFSPQLPIFEDTTIYRLLGETVTIDLRVDEDVADNE